jgi:hypothetical protein
MIAGIAFACLLVTFGSLEAGAEINLNAGIAGKSPDGMRVMVNGCITSTDSVTVGSVCDDECDKVFSCVDTGGGSHPLVWLIFRYSEQQGLDKLPVFMELFSPAHFAEHGRIFARTGGLALPGRTDNRVTFFAAALAHVFSVDARSDFRALSFPVRDELYDGLLRTWTAGAATH